MLDPGSSGVRHSPNRHYFVDPFAAQPVLERTQEATSSLVQLSTSGVSVHFWILVNEGGQDSDQSRPAKSTLKCLD